MTNLLLIVSLLLHPTVLDGHRAIIAKTGSMLPSIPINSVLIVDDSLYATSDPQRFDIVVIKRRFRNTPEDLRDETMEVVCRVIGLPGETIALREGNVYINGRLLKESFAKNECLRKTDGTAPCEMAKLKIPDGEYFLLADNRDESEDSRLWLPQTIPQSEVLGKVVKIIPPNASDRLTCTSLSLL